jgi:hypothetical protein
VPMGLLVVGYGVYMSCGPKVLNEHSCLTFSAYLNARTDPMPCHAMLLTKYALHPLSLHVLFWFALCCVPSAATLDESREHRTQTLTQILGTIKTTARTTMPKIVLCYLHNIDKDADRCTF